MNKTRLTKYLDSFNPFNTESPRNRQSGIREILDCGIRNPRLWNLEFSSMNPESRFQVLRTRNLESSIWDGVGWGLWAYKSKTVTRSFRLRSLAALSRHDLSGTCRWMWYGFLPSCFEQWTRREYILSGSAPDKREYDMQDWYRYINNPKSEDFLWIYLRSY